MIFQKYNLLPVVLAFVFSSILSRVRTIKFDRVLSQVQHIHEGSISRLGGVAAFAALIISTFLNGKIIAESGLIFVILLGSIAFMVGLIDDWFGHIRPSIRLLSLFIVGLASLHFIGVIERVKVPFVDFEVANYLVLSIITLVGFVGITNAFNLIDGLNGLSSGVGIIVLIGLGFISEEIGLQSLQWFCSILASSIFGFFLVNFPKGKIFFGDAGAYLTGFVVAAVSIVLIRYSADVSSWSLMLICAYPIWETCFSVLRRVTLNQKWWQADQQHLHHLILHLIEQRLRSLHFGAWLANPCASLLCMILAGFPVLMSVRYYFSSAVLSIGFVSFFLFYSSLYLLLRKVNGNCISD